MPKNTLDGPAKKKAESLRDLLKREEVDPQLVEQRYGAMCGMLGPQFGLYRRQVLRILGEEQAAKLVNLTKFEL
jgi:hypothetical protein